jgi:hypothetical protein
MTKKRHPHATNFKRDKTITENEAGKIVAIYNQWKRMDYFVAKDVKQAISAISSQAIQRYLWIGRELGLFAFKIKPVGNIPAIYQCVKLDDPMVKLTPHIVETKHRRKVAEIITHDTPCALANLLGYVPIDHECKPRLVINDYRGGKIERARSKVFVSGEWRL